MRRTPSPVTSLVLAGACWGTSYAVVGLVDGATPMLIAGSRFAIFGLVAAALLQATGGFGGIPWTTAALHAIGGSVGLYLAELTAISMAAPVRPLPLSVRFRSSTRWSAPIATGPVFVRWCPRSASPWRRTW